MIRLSRTVVCVLTVLACAMASRAQEAAPGTINCVEGHVAVDGQEVGADASVAAVQPGHVLETQQGRAEVLLTPGVFLRVAENSTIKMDEASQKDVRFELVRGEALVEVDQVDQRRQLDVVDKDADARLEQRGIYLFNASQPAIAVYSGKIRVEDDRRVRSLGRGAELKLDGGALKAQRFDRKETDAIYAWTLRRADYASQVSEWTGEGLLGLDGSGYYAEGWYWNPWFRSWAFVPAKGHRVSPLGYGFYAPTAPHYLAPVFGDFRSR